MKDKEDIKALGEMLQLPKVADPRGNLTVAEQNRSVPFEIRRVYWTYDVPSGGRRGGHAHKAISEFLVATSGSFHVTLDNGRQKHTFLLNHPWEGLLIHPGVWRTLEDFSSGAVCMVMASDFYDEADYIRNYKEYRKWVKTLAAPANS